jgi:GNAT superfamily N-acetyltransferase
MRRRADVMYVRDDAGRALRTNQWDGGTPPLAHLFRTAAGNAVCLSAALPEAVAGELAECLAAEPVRPDPRAPLACGDELVALLAAVTDSVVVSGGPAFLLPVPIADPPDTGLLDPGDADRLGVGVAEWGPEIGERQPFAVAWADGHAEAVCVSARIGDAVHEAGVATSPDFRRRGLAAAATARWARAVAARGAQPCYSTLWDNLASQRTAARLGGRCYGSDVTIRAATP